MQMYCRQLLRGRTTAPCPDLKAGSTQERGRIRQVWHAYPRRGMGYKFNKNQAEVTKRMRTWYQMAQRPGQFREHMRRVLCMRWGEAMKQKCDGT